jgi:hypothetical protein
MIEENPGTAMALTRLETEVEDETKTPGEEILAQILGEAIQETLNEIKENSEKYVKTDHKRKLKNKKKFS